MKKWVRWVGIDVEVVSTYNHIDTFHLATAVLIECSEPQTLMNLPSSVGAFSISICIGICYFSETPLEVPRSFTLGLANIALNSSNACLIASTS